MKVSSRTSCRISRKSESVDNFGTKITENLISLSVDRRRKNSEQTNRIEWWSRPEFRIHVSLKSGFLFVRKSVVEQEFITEFRIQKSLIFRIPPFSVVRHAFRAHFNPEVKLLDRNFFGWDFRINPIVNFRINPELP